MLVCFYLLAGVPKAGRLWFLWIPSAGRPGAEGEQPYAQEVQSPFPTAAHFFPVTASLPTLPATLP